ncbi:MAG: hypothetical protein KDH09_06320 [Chrysiogenetes bacterium]|nr:hypothetical protein [Chrysiogenetes bacterium]
MALRGVSDARLVSARLIRVLPEPEVELRGELELELLVTGVDSLTLRDLVWRVRMGEETLVRGGEPALELRVDERGIARTRITFEFLPRPAALLREFAAPVVVEASAVADLGLYDYPISLEREIPVADMVRQSLGF